MTRLTVVTERDDLAEAMAAAFEVMRCAPRVAELVTGSDYPDAYLVEVNDVEQLPLVEQVARATARPIVVVAPGVSGEVVAAYLEYGADAVVRDADCLEECVARVKAVTRRAAGADAREETFAFGHVRLYPERRSVMRGSEPLHFTRTEFNLLLALARRMDQVISHRQLMQDVWGQEYLSARHYLRVYVRRIREKLEADADAPVLLISYRAKGYMLRSTPLALTAHAHSDADVRHRAGASGAEVGEGPYVPSLAG
ncbi:MAG: response regulator transcription factor [Dehalococcoidia bacterium]